MDRSKWEYKKLGEVCAPKSDILRANKLFGNDDIIDYVDISSIDNTTHSITQPTSYVFKEAPSRAQQKVEQGDILYSLVRPNLKNIAVVTSSDTDKYVASSGFCVLRGKDVETRYLYHLVLGDAFTNYILGLVSGANYPAVREDDVKGFSFRCPPVADQQRIVAELDCLNEMIALKQEQLKEFDKLAQSIFYDMFGDPVTNEKGWELSKLGKIGELGRGVSKHRPRNAPELLGGTMPLIQTGDVANAEMYITDYNATYSELGVKQSKIWKAGTLCITIAATIGKCAILSFDACFPDSVVGFSTNDELTNNEYIYFIFMSLQKILEQNAPAVAQKNINLAVLNALDIPLPPLALQQQFAEKIQAIEAQKELVKQSIAETQHLLDSRMDYYFD